MRFSLLLHNLFIAAVSPIICLTLMIWVAAGTGCIGAAGDGEEKSETPERISKVESETQSDAADRPEANAPEAIEIPLDQIWAYGMPGTRNILNLDADKPLGIRVGGPLSYLSLKGKEIAGPSFAVLGTGMEAFLATHANLPEGQKPQDSFPLGSDISVVFFSRGADYHVHLHRIEWRGNLIVIRYRPVPHRNASSSASFALIPIGKLPAGTFHIKIVRSPMEAQYSKKGFKRVSDEWEQRAICKPFSFSITERK